MTFPDFQTIADLVLCDLVGYFRSPEKSNCGGVRFHQGFLRDSTRVSELSLSLLPPSVSPDHLPQSQNDNLASIKDLIKNHRGRISRVLITGTGKGAAVASIFTLRHAREILSWSKVNVTDCSKPENNQAIDLRCVTFGCPKFIQSRDIASVDSEISSRIIHLYGEHEFVPLSLTSLTKKYGRVGLIVNINGSPE
jgi:hypothetical protein